jgi:SAM-dependent methyltransferase
MNQIPTRALLVSFEEWISTPQGRYVMAWEMAALNDQVTDIFGYNAAQFGCTAVNALAESRMQTRAVFGLDTPSVYLGQETGISYAVIDSFAELPISDESLDLVVLPHILECCQDPHAMLREVDRVLRPEGKLIVTGFNPVSLWGLSKPTPRVQLIGLPRLKDWLKLLGFDNDQSLYGCYRPPFADEALLNRLDFIETAGDRWWPICGALYIHCAVKKVRGMRLIAPNWRKVNAKAKARPALAGKNMGEMDCAEKSESEIA